MSYSLITTQQPQPFDIPFIGDDIARIGRVIDLWASPCTPTADIWVYGMFKAIPTLFVTLVKPEIIDINIRHRHGRPRKGKRFRFLSQALFRDAIIEIPVPRWVVFRVYEWGQRIGWYMLVADATETFAINWMSLAYKYSGCHDPVQAFSHRTNTQVLQGSPSSGIKHTVWVTGIDTQNFNYPGGIAQPALNGVYRVSWNASFEPYQIPAQSELPSFSWLLIEDQPFYRAVAYEKGGNNRFVSGGGLLDVFSTPRPTINVGLQYENPGKFCYMTAQMHIDRLTPLDPELEPDP